LIPAEVIAVQVKYIIRVTEAKTKKVMKKLGKVKLPLAMMWYKLINMNVTNTATKIQYRKRNR